MDMEDTADGMLRLPLPRAQAIEVVDEALRRAGFVDVDEAVSAVVEAMSRERTRGMRPELAASAVPVGFLARNEATHESLARALALCRVPAAA